MRTTLIVNSKGGSGKTTMSTTLASYYANRNLKTAIMDFDPQGSSLNWLKVRPDHLKSIHGANAAKAKNGTIRSWQMKLPNDIERLILDSPAGSNGILLQDLVRRSDSIIIPVAPSSTDVHATADFVKELLLVGKVRAYKTQVSVVANRVRKNDNLYQPLANFLNSLQIPFVASITDTDNYVFAAEQGMGIYDMKSDKVSLETSQWQPLLKWLDNPSAPTSEAAEKNRRNLKLVSTK